MPVPAEPGSTLAVKQDWSGEHHVELEFAAGIRTRTRSYGAVTVSRGPILFALAVDENWRQIGGQEPYGDWEVHPAGPWNYTLQLNPDQPESGLRVETRPVEHPVFSTGGTPIRLLGKATIASRWQLRHGAAAAPPTSPCLGDGPARDVVLLPYGVARLRLTEIPWHNG